MNDVAGQPLPMDDADEDAMGRLLVIAGPRLPVPAERASRVRAEVHRAWLTGRRRRTVRRRVLSVALAAAAVLGLIAGRVLLNSRPAVPPAELVAVVEQINGTPRRAADVASLRTAAKRLAANESIYAGEWIETDALGRVALRFSDGTSVRLDLGSRARPLSSSVIELSAGAVYVDTGRESGRFEVRTPLATARDVGTQFEVRLLDVFLRLRVRSGTVELRTAARTVSGRGGTEVMLSATGAERRTIATYGSEWDWTTRVSPPLEMEGLPLSAFLQRMAREHGWTIRYSDAALARDASGIILHGSTAGLPPGDAIGVAITTSGLGHRFEDGELIVLRGPEAR